MNLMQRIFKGNPRDKEKLAWRGKEFKPVLKSFGVTLEMFPFNDYNNTLIPLNFYSTRFENIGLTLKPKRILTGDYVVTAIASSCSECGWLPGKPMRYSFEVKDGELNIWEQER